MAAAEDPGRQGGVPSSPSGRPGKPSQTVGADMSLDIQLLELRRSLDVATTKIDGQLAVLLQKSDYAEQRARESAERVAAELAARDSKLEHLGARIDGQDTKMDNLKGRVYFMSGVASVFGIAAGIVATLVTKH